MSLLFDTHAWLWFFLGDPRLGPHAQRLLTDPQNSRFLSIASCWELAIKVSTGRYQLTIPYLDFVDQGTVGVQTTILPVEPRHLDRLTALPFHHRDPFDRLIIAQAQADGLTLLSADRQFAPYGVSVVW